MVVATDVLQPRAPAWLVGAASCKRKPGITVLCSSDSDAALWVHKDFMPPPPWSNSLEQQQALTKLEIRLAMCEHDCPDVDTLRWFLRDSDFKVAAAESKLRAMLAWRAAHRFSNVQFQDVSREYQTGKAVVHHHWDTQGRPAVIVTAAKHRTGEYPLEDSKRLATYMLDSAVSQLPADASGAAEQLLLVIDLKGISMSNIDLAFVAFVVDTVPEHYPRRIAQVLLVDAPWIFKAPWEAFKPMLRKYAALVKFINRKELAEAYFTAETLPSNFK